MEGFVTVGPVERFPEGRGRRVRVEGVDVAVFRVDGSWYALRDGCPHMGASLAEGRLEASRITCHWHGWSFDLATGKSDRRSGACARVYEIRVRDGEVQLRPPAPARDDAADDGDDWFAFDPDRHLKR